ncbi:MAG TPA: GGDEF domain-containing protein [Gaiellaceae bacterium]|nr:GGDEF domain-containing protein [Gaiellaceae bacterium]
MESAVHRYGLPVLAVVLYGVVTAGVLFLEHPGLGLGHFYYIPILLLAIWGGPLVGLTGGVVAVVLYQGAVVLNPELPSMPVWSSAAIRLTTFVAVGVIVGRYAQSNRTLVSELSRLAGRDKLTGLPNTRAFESAIATRLERDEPFALVVGDIDELRHVNGVGEEHGDDLLRKLADRLMSAKRANEDVARVGGDEFAVLSPLPRGSARMLALLLERQLSGPNGTMTFGWAAYPHDGDNALALYRVADERLYARKVARGFRRGVSRSLSGAAATSPAS